VAEARERNSRVITFFFDFSSTYTYIAMSEIEALAVRQGCETRWRPFLLGAAMKAHGSGIVPKLGTARGDYMAMDAGRVAAMHGLPFKMPRRFPFNSTLPARAFYWIDRDDTVAAKAFAAAVSRAAFGAGNEAAETTAHNMVTNTKLNLLGQAAGAVAGYGVNEGWFDNVHNTTRVPKRYRNNWSGGLNNMPVQLNPGYQMTG